MLKRLQAPPENGTIAGYTSELSHFLRNGIPGEQADEIVQEAHAHLLDRADALAAQNAALSPKEAEAQAVAAFTPAVTFAREMAQSAYETRHSKAWRKTGRMVAGAAFIFLLSLLEINDFFSEKLLILLIVAVPFTAVCAFQVRQAQTRQLLLCGTLATVFVFLYTGFNYLDGSPVELDYGASTQGTRNSIAFGRQSCQRLAGKREREIRQLQAGLNVFQTSKNDIPAEWKESSRGGYLVPTSYQVELHRSYRDQATLNIVDMRPPFTLFHPFHTDAPEVVTSLAEARSRWQTDGPLWLAQVKRIQVVDRRCEQIYQAALLKREFANYTATRYAGIIGKFALFLVVWDKVFAAWGRAIYAKRRKSHKTKRA